jgi:hypothetical protein
VDARDAIDVPIEGTDLRLAFLEHSGGEQRVGEVQVAVCKERERDLKGLLVGIVYAFGGKQRE